jgi:hypothetical protein
MIYLVHLLVWYTKWMLNLQFQEMSLFKCNRFPNIKFGDPLSAFPSYQFYSLTSGICPSDHGEVMYLSGAFLVILMIFLRARKDQNLDVWTQHNFKLYLILYCI